MLIDLRSLVRGRFPLKDCSSLGKLAYWTIWLCGLASVLCVISLMIRSVEQLPSGLMIQQTFSWAFSSCSALSFFGLLFGITAIFVREDRALATIFSTVFNLVAFLACLAAVAALQYLNKSGN